LGANLRILFAAANTICHHVVPPRCASNSFLIHHFFSLKIPCNRRAQDQPVSSTRNRTGKALYGIKLEWYIVVVIVCRFFSVLFFFLSLRFVNDIVRMALLFLVVVFEYQNPDFLSFFQLDPSRHKFPVLSGTQP